MTRDPASWSDTDRRSQPRSEVLATAVVFSADKMHGTYLIEDLTSGGALLVGPGRLPVGGIITLLVRWRGKTLSGVAARVVRRGHDDMAGTRFGVVFLNLQADEEDAIHQMLVAELERMHARKNATALLLHGEGEARDALERNLRRWGLQVMTVGTPSEALGWLQRPDTKIDTALIDLDAGATLLTEPSADLLRFLCEERPGIRRIVVSDGHRSFRIDLALRSGRAQALLERPWSEARLEEIFGGKGTISRPHEAQPALAAEDSTH